MKLLANILSVQDGFTFYLLDISCLIIYMQLHEGVKKSGIMGFCDPCPGEPKQLYVEYTFDGNNFEVNHLLSIFFLTLENIPC